MCERCKELEVLLSEAKKECERLKRELNIADYTVQTCVGNYDFLGKANATLKAELATLKETKEAYGVLASITKTFGGMRDNASYEAEIAELKAENAEAKKERERYKFERDELRGLHDAGIKEAYRICGVEDDGEYRWKWVLLELATLKAEKEKADQIIKDLSSDRMLYKDMAEKAGARLKMCVWILVKQGNMARMRAAQIVGINIADMDDFMKEQDKTALARLEEIENELKQAVEGKG